MTAVTLLHARRGYRKRRRLTPLGVALLGAMLFVPNLLLEYATACEMPGTALGFVGVFLGGAGLLLCLASIAFFHSGTSCPMDATPQACIRRRYCLKATTPGETCRERLLNTRDGLRAVQEEPGVCRSARAVDLCGSSPVSRPHT